MGLASSRRCNCIHEYLDGEKVLGSGSSTSPYIHERPKIIDITDPYSGESLEKISGQGIFALPKTVRSITVSDSGELTSLGIEGQVSYDPGLQNFSIRGADYNLGNLNVSTEFDVDSNGRIVLVGVGDINSAVPFNLENNTQHLVNVNPPTRQISYCQIHDTTPSESTQFFYPANVQPTTTGMFRHELPSVISRTTPVITRINFHLAEDNFLNQNPSYILSPITPFTLNEYIEFEIFRVIKEQGNEIEFSIGKFYWSQNGSRGNAKLLSLLDSPVLEVGQTLSYVITVPKQLDSGNGRNMTYKYSFDFMFI